MKKTGNKEVEVKQIIEKNQEIIDVLKKINQLFEKERSEKKGFGNNLPNSR